MQKWKEIPILTTEEVFGISESERMEQIGLYKSKMNKAKKEIIQMG